MKGCLRAVWNQMAEIILHSLNKPLEKQRVEAENSSEMRDHLGHYPLSILHI